MPSSMTLGIPGLVSTPGVVSEPARWLELKERYGGRPLLHSDGLSVEIGAPQLLEDPLLGRFARTVELFDQFYRIVTEAYFESPASRGDFLVNPKFEGYLRRDEVRATVLPLARLDCVLTEDGEIRVIEINPVGVCTLHLRVGTYIANKMCRVGLEEDAAAVRSLDRELVASLERFYAAEMHGEGSPSVGLIYYPAGLIRASRAVMREWFRGTGVSLVEGMPADVGSSAGRLTLRGKPVDLLWGDFLFYLGYQMDRYLQTKWSSKFPDFSGNEAESLALLGDRSLQDLSRARRFFHVSPLRSYLALSKNLLSWLHRGESVIPEELRDQLSGLTARTYGLSQRAEGVVSRARVVRERGDFVLKPCQFGGAHGVILGAEVSRDEWAARIEETWDSPHWCLQDFYQPVRTAGGQWTSFGLYSFGGRFGGGLLRTARSQLISARQAACVPLLLPT